RGNQASGTLIVRPSSKSTTRVSVVVETSRARMAVTSIVAMVIPAPQEFFVVGQHKLKQPIELASPESVASLETNRRKPELGNGRISFNVDVRRLTTVPGVKEAPVRTSP